jgi:hypothetical protein
MHVVEPLPLPASSAPTRHCRAPGVAFSPLQGGGSEGLSPLWGGKLAREGFPTSREKVAYQRRLVTYPIGQGLRAHGKRILPGSLCHPRRRAWETRGRSPLQRTCKRHHCHARGSNDGLDRLVKSHQRIAPDGARRQLGD